MGDSPVAWIVQSIIAYWIVGGCYPRYVDKIGSNTILLLSSIPYHWIGTMGHCHPTQGIEVYVDANFAGGWDPGDAMNADNVYS